jgi:hypothetical protein
MAKNMKTEQHGGLRLCLHECPTHVLQRWCKCGALDNRAVVPCDFCGEYELFEIDCVMKS